MKHLGVLAHSAEGAALCFRAFCQEGLRRLGPHDHPDVTMDCIAQVIVNSKPDVGPELVPVPDTDKRTTMTTAVVTRSPARFTN